MLLLLLFITISTLGFIWIKWHFNHWKRRGYPYVEAKIPFGVLDGVRTGQRSLGMAIYDVYKSRSEKVVGIFLFFRPALLVRDAELARDILAKDFASFHDRGIYVDEEKDPISGSIFALEGQKWRTTRNKLAPAFTSGKLKVMFSTINEIGDKMVEYLKGKVTDQQPVELEIKSIISSYAIDIIGNVLFGLEVDSFKDPNNVFRHVDKIVNEPTFKSIIRGTAQFLYPTLEKIFVFFGWSEEAPTLMKNIVKETVESREKNNLVRRDMLQLLLQLRNTGKINVDDEIWSAQSVAESLKSMSVEAIAAHLFLFYVAGYETSASAASFTLYEMSRYPEIMLKAQRDIDAALEKHNGELSYECIKDMKYLDLCVKETIRKYPGLPILNRVCTEDYTIPGTNQIIEKGTAIIISNFGMQRDAEYFPDPFSYQPERYLEDNMNYNPVAYIPFGDGPRHCIAQRMGTVNVKVALTKILSNFNVEENKNWKEIKIANYGIPIMPEGGVKVRLTKRFKQ